MDATPYSDGLMNLPDGIWALVDSNQIVEQPSPLLGAADSPFFVVHVTPSDMEHPRWFEEKGGVRWVMDTWAWDEIAFAYVFYCPFYTRFLYDISPIERRSN